MPRNITVHLPNGNTRTYQNVPDNVTVGQMRARIQQDFPGQRMVTPAARPAAPLPKTSAGGSLWRGIEDAVPFRNYLQAATNEAGSALGLNNTPSSMSYMDRVRALKAQHDVLEDADRAQHPIAHYVGEAGGLVIGGGGTGALAKGIVSKVAPRAATAIANVLQNSRAARVTAASLGGGAAGATYAAGDANPENAGSAAETGGISGAILGPVLGAAANRVPGLGLRLAKFVTAPFTKAMAVPDAARALGTITNSTADDMNAAAAKFRAANNGAEPTLFQLLPLADRNRLTRGVLAKNDTVAEQATDAIDATRQQIGPQMAAHVQAVVAPQREAVQNGLMNDLATARGGTNDPADAGLVSRAMNSPTDMSELRDTEAHAIMAPHENTPAADNFSDILPQAPQNNNGTITMVDGDPAVTAAIRSAAPGGFRASNQGVTAGDISDMIQTLRGDLGKGGIEGRTAQQAIDHLEGELAARAPDAAVAHQQMTDAYAARSRMLEGMKAGHAPTLRNDVQVGTNRGQARLVRNEYDTPEGQAGLMLGTSNRLVSDLGSKSTNRAVGAISDMADNDLGPQIEQNLGSDAAGKIMSAAQKQAKGAQALAQASGKISGGVGDSSDLLHTAVQTASALHPSSYPATKLGAIQKLRNLVGMPQNRAQTIVDMLFSQDPTLTQRAIDALGDNGTAMVKYMAGIGGAIGAQPATAQEATGAGAAVKARIAPSTAAPVAASAPAAPVDASAAQPPAAPAAPVDNAGGAAPVDPSDPYSAALAHVRQTENPDFISLIDRQFQQESGGQQFDPKTGKPLTSKKGAIGHAQVMPGTGPEGAAYWGLPWDPDLLRTSPSYNQLVGMGYMAKQLQKYGGNVPKALSAYNHGPTGTDNAIRAGGEQGWLGQTPAETQDYVQSIAQ